MAVITNFGVPVSGESGATLMPKLQYRFRVTFQNLGASNSGSKATRNVVSVTRPSLDHEDVTIDAYNSKIRLAGKHTWQDITLVLRDDVDNEVVRLLGAQLNRQVNHGTQEAPRAGGDYKFGMTIEMLDGSQDDTDLAVIDKWTLAGCFVPSIQYGDLNYATSDVVQITATIRYDNASHDVDGVDVLGAENIDSTGSVTSINN